jgi:uncharacterized membrane protein YoaK (UPF0700 family)
MPLLPDELLIFLALGAAFSLMLGAKKLAMALLGTVLIVALAGPFVDAALEALPLWLLVLLALVLLLGLLRLLANLVLGRDAAADFIAIIAAKLFLGLVFAPFRLVRAIVRLFWR